MNWLRRLKIWPKQKVPSSVQPIVSIVVVIFNMEREAKRTLYSLTSKYQEGISEQAYEVIVVDNGSSVQFSRDYFESLGSNFNYYYIKDASPSPASAVNFGVSQSRGRIVGLMIDGARILSPGVIKYALLAFQTFQNPIVGTLGWHLGSDLQNRSILNGYSQKTEDQLLESIDWANDGYRLFEIASLAGSSQNGWFLPINESNCLFMLRETFDKLNGYDERFDSAGGGLVNLDFYSRCCELLDSELIHILGEGNFHQIHGGVATNIPEQANRMKWKEWEEQYFKIWKKKYVPPVKRPLYLGHVPHESLEWILYSAEKAIEKLDNVQSQETGDF
jgi:glycosyltransferase involved in cell wall biosynthesis